MFADDFREALRSAPRRALPAGECQTANGQVCTVCHGFEVDYPTEVAAREAALDVFWRRMVRDVPRDPLVLSPRGRNYRTVSKRKMVRGHLGLLDERKRPVPVMRCAVRAGATRPYLCRHRTRAAPVGPRARR